VTDQSAVATREESRSEIALRSPLVVTSVAGRGDIERVESVVTIPSNFQYVITARKNERYQDERGQWHDNWMSDNKVGLTSDGYDYANRSLGAGFWLPKEVPDDMGNMVANPIHRPDYIYIRMGAVWYNAVGQLVSHTEDLEVNYKMVWYQNRLESPGAEQMLDKNQQPIFDEMGQPMIVLHDHTYEGRGDKPGKTVTGEEQERKALKSLMSLRAMGMRYAQTVLRVRLLKVATGIKSLPMQQPAPFKLSIVGYRDKMEPSERQAQAEKALGALYGNRPDAKPLSAGEMAEIEPAEVETMESAIEADTSGSVLPLGLDDEFDLPE
jgi:hypothetical protein